MKKIGLIICGLFTLLAVSVKAAPITESDAKSVAEVFCAKKGIEGDLKLSDVKNEESFIFNSSKGGFVIVAADDRITPILGYSKTGSITGTRESFAFENWMNSVDESVGSLLSSISESQIDKTQWVQLKSGNHGVTTRNYYTIN